MPIILSRALVLRRLPREFAHDCGMKSPIRKLLANFRALALRGRRFRCPLCSGEYRRFLSAGNPPRANAMCPGCASLERHRLLWLALQQGWNEGGLAAGVHLLHVAPEPVLAAQLAQRFEQYVSIDLEGKQAMQAMDVTDLSFTDESFDAVVCNHVMEHVPNDRAAIAELFRVLKPGGWGSIQVPMLGEATKEDLSITDPAQRRRLYGQEDHVRMYGRDFMERLREAGFNVLVLPKQDLADPIELSRISVDCEDMIVLVSKPMAETPVLGRRKE